jgi:hypothetical protein
MPIRCRPLPPTPPPVDDGAEDGIGSGIQVLAEILGEEAQDQAAVLLEKCVLAAVAAVGDRIVAGAALSARTPAPPRPVG